MMAKIKKEQQFGRGATDLLVHHHCGRKRSRTDICALASSDDILAEIRVPYDWRGAYLTSSLRKEQEER